MRPREIARRALIEDLSLGLGKHGFRAGDMPDEIPAGDMTDEEIEDLLTEIGVTRADTVFGAIMIEFNGGLFLRNIEDDEIRLKRVNALAGAGALPHVQPEHSGIMAGLGRAIDSVANTNQELDRTLNEMIQLGAERLVAVQVERALSTDPFGDLPASSLQGGIKTYLKGLEKQAVKDGLHVEQSVNADRLQALSEGELQELLRASDPDVGLSPMHNAMVLAQKPGLQGIVRASLLKAQSDECLELLTRSGVAPVLKKKSFLAEEGGGFFSRITGVIGNAFNGPSPKDYRDRIITTSRSMLRERIEELRVEALLEKRADTLTPSFG